MQLHTIKRKNRNKTKKIVGRGGKRGTYSGRGLKGQKARAGRKMRPELRDIIKKLPKKRGYKFSTFRESPTAVNVEKLERFFKNGEEVTIESLVRRGIVKKSSGKMPQVKILGAGKLTHSITIKGLSVSKVAEEKITKAKGKVVSADDKKDAKTPKSEKEKESNKK
jgi:large subunit ribosomal protein L15